ncbi:MAG: 2-amino-4-hydroxy-6-hydroxymethyldihydropteridine diphosphokinase [Muribaculaceae bacterium]|nr:2-amino-4-hydroxy-6-hydroxymethyldihydropteridine diphosphokinase [Muribaculaceae bacterium]
MLAHINIGSNIGDSRSAIERAVAAVFALSEGDARRSSIVVSEPWGFESPNRFLNVGVEIETSLPPEELLGRLQDVERGISPASHRNPDGSYRDRLIDIDLIFMARRNDTPDGWETVINDSPLLTLPHPRASERPFVVAPVKELHPALIRPEALFLKRP